MSLLLVLFTLLKVAFASSHCETRLSAAIYYPKTCTAVYMAKTVQKLVLQKDLLFNPATRSTVIWKFEQAYGMTVALIDAMGNKYTYQLDGMTINVHSGASGSDTISSGRLAAFTNIPNYRLSSETANNLYHTQIFNDNGEYFTIEVQLPLENGNVFCCD